MAYWLRFCAPQAICVNEALARREAGNRGLASQLKGCRYALWKNPEHLSTRQRAKLAWVATLNNCLYRAYLLKEELRLVVRLKGDQNIRIRDQVGELHVANQCVIKDIITYSAAEPKPPRRGRQQF